MEILTNPKPRQGASLPPFGERFPIRKLDPDFHPDYLLKIAEKLQFSDRLCTQGEILPGDCRAVAIVGSRVCHPDTDQKAYKLAFALARQGVRIVSRLDFGVDEAAHKGAVEAVGRTLMVLPRGLGRVHPVSNRSFYQATIETGGGAGISSYPQGSPRRPKGHQHLAQNDRLIASLSQALIVVEAQKKSDTMSCALAALTRGRPVGFLPHMLERSWVQNLFAKNLLGHLLFVVHRPEDVLEKLAS